MFKRLVGDDYYRNVVLGTTFWDTLTSKERGEAREAEFMREDALWADLIQGQSKVMRLGFQAADGDLPTFAKDAISPSETDLNVLLEICENHQSEALCAQREMDQGLNSGETSAVRELNEWRQRARQHQERRAQIQERIREQLASNNMRFGQQLEEECLRMDQIYEQQTREFAVDQARLRESRHQIQSLMQERSGRRPNGRPTRAAADHRHMQQQIDARRRANNIAAQQIIDSARRACAFYRERRQSSGIVRCKPKCKANRCGRVIRAGEKFFHCCSCRQGSHNYHHCQGCGNRCGRNHGDMLELQVAAR